VRLLQVPARLLSPLIVMFCVVGAFSLNNNVIDVFVMFLAGIAGFLMRRAVLDPAPLIIAFVLGTMFETTLHQSLAIGYGSAWVFLERPISAFLLAATVLIILVSTLWRTLRRAPAGAT
jgi:putative tricarboxylic transport membrane protein